MFKLSHVLNTESRLEANQILDRIYQEQPSHWPNGLYSGSFDGGLYLVREKRSNTAAGFVGWQERLERDGGQRVKVGYYSIGILPEFRRNGYAKEAISKLIAEKSAGVDRVRALIVETNKPSQKLADALGVEKIVKKAFFRNAERDRVITPGEGAAAIGAGVLGDTYQQLGQAGRAADNMGALHKGVVARQFSDLKDPDAVYRLFTNYGNTAQSALRTRLGGVSAGHLASKFPLSLLFDKDTDKFSPTNLVKHHTGVKSLSPADTLRLNSTAAHYDGYRYNPSAVQFKELATGSAVGNYNQMPGVFRRSGMTPEIWGKITASKDPLRGLMDFIKASPKKEGLMKAVYQNHARHLFAGGMHAGDFFAGKLPDAAKSLSYGPAAYAGGMTAAVRRLRPLAGLGALGLAGAGAAHYYQRKTASTMAPSPEVEIANGAAGLGLGGYMLNNSRKYKPSNLILTTAGHLKAPVATLDTGAGHVAPAKGLAELLRSHPSVQSGEFVVDTALREMDPAKLKSYTDGLNGKAPKFNLNEFISGNLLKPFRPSNVAQHGKQHAQVLIESGFGANFAAPSMHQPEFTWNPKGVIGVNPDFVHDSGALNAKTVLTRGLNITDPGTPLISFGRKLRPGSHDKRMPYTSKPFSHTSVNPLVGDNIINESRAWLKHSDPSGVWNNTANAIEQFEPQSAKLIRDGVASGKKFVTITGSSRGDLVAYRAATLQRLLQRHGLADKIQIVAAMGNAHGDPHDYSGKLLDKFPQVARIGHTAKYKNVSPQQLINAASLHIGSTGASAQAEAMLSPTTTLYNTNFNRSMRNQIKLLKNLGLPTAAHQGIDLNSWNHGIMQQINDWSAKGNMGVGRANKATDVLPYLRRIAAGETLHNPERARSMIAATSSARKSLADKIITHATHLQSSARRSRDLRVGLGLAGLGAGAGALAHGLSRRHEIQSEPWNRAKETINKLNPWEAIKAKLGV